jgi:hypothetical protein
MMTGIFFPLRNVVMASLAAARASVLLLMCGIGKGDNCKGLLHPKLG